MRPSARDETKWNTKNGESLKILILFPSCSFDEMHAVLLYLIYSILRISLAIFTRFHLEGVPRTLCLYISRDRDWPWPRLNSYFRGKDRKLIRYSGQIRSIDSSFRPKKKEGVFAAPLTIADFHWLYMTRLIYVWEIALSCTRNHKKKNYGTDTYWNECVPETEKKTQRTVGTDGRLPKENSPALTGEVTRRAGGLPGPRHLQKKPAEPSGQGAGSLLEHRREILLQGDGHSKDTGGRTG